MAGGASDGVAAAGSGAGPVAPGSGAGLTIARAARAVGLSRTTLLYYERLGLVRPRRRAGSRYRAFGADELRALVLISRWRSVGVPLATIRQLLAQPDTIATVLAGHLRALERGLEALREQRRRTLELLGRRSGRGVAPMSKGEWTRMFRAVGLSDAQMQRWHAEFEQRNGAAHGQFLRSLGLPASEIGRIRRWSKVKPPGAAMRKRSAAQAHAARARARRTSR